MPESLIRAAPVLEPSEYDAIDRFAASHRGEGGLGPIAGWLRERFSAEITLDPDLIIGFATDSSNLPGRAGALARPASVRECAAVFRACFRAGIPFTISAGRSNLTGSATPEGGVVVSTVRMTSPAVSIDAAAMRARAPAGVILEDARKAVLELSGGRLHYPVDPTSRADATVGGTIACNASGFVPGAAGATREWVEAIELLLPNGLLVRARRGELVSQGGAFLVERPGGSRTALPVPRYARPSIKNAGGPYSAPGGAMDLVDMVVGSEGIYGLVTACELRLAPRPPGYADLFVSLPAEADAVRLLHHLRARPCGLGDLSALEYFGVNCRRHMDHEERLFRGGDQVAVYIQSPLAAGEAAEDAAERLLGEFAASGAAFDEEAVLLLDNDRDRAVFFESRHSLPANALEVVKRRGTFTIMTDAAVPPGRFAEFLDFANGLIAREGMDYVSFGHLGDCHLHFTILPEKAHLARAAQVYDEIIAKSAELGGVYSAEHGTGKRKRADFIRCYGRAAADEVRRAKAALDPELLLNRGNVFEP